MARVRSRATWQAVCAPLRATATRVWRTASTSTHCADPGNSRDTNPLESHHRRLPLRYVLFRKSRAGAFRPSVNTPSRASLLRSEEAWNERSGLLAAVWRASTIDAQELPVRIVELLRHQR